MVVNKKNTVIFRNVMPCPLAECLGGTHIHNPEDHSLNQQNGATTCTHSTEKHKFH